MTRAMKILPKESIADEEKTTLLKEVAILKTLDHPNIIKIYDLYEDEEYYYLITEYGET
jgi:calcium-dependent protein kinase